MKEMNVDGAEADAAMSKFDCKEGCALCCLDVPEAFGDDYTRFNDDEELKKALTEVPLNPTRVGPSSGLALQGGVGACVLLKDRKCSHYDKRPFHCRAYPLQFYLGPEGIDASITFSCPGLIAPEEKFADGLKRLMDGILANRAKGSVKAPKDVLAILDAYPIVDIEATKKWVVFENEEVIEKLKGCDAYIEHAILKPLFLEIIPRLTNKGSMSKCLKWLVGQGVMDFHNTIAEEVSDKMDYAKLADKLFDKWISVEGKLEVDEVMRNEHLSVFQAESYIELPIWVTDDYKWLLFHAMGETPTTLEVKEMNADGSLNDIGKLDTADIGLMELDDKAKELLETYLRVIVERPLFEGHIMVMEKNYQCKVPNAALGVTGLLSFAAVIWFRASIIATYLKKEKISAEEMAHGISFFDATLYDYPFLGAVL